MVQTLSTLLFAVAVLSAATGPSVVAHSDGKSKEQVPVAVDAHDLDQPHVPSWLNSLVQHGYGSHKTPPGDHKSHFHKNSHGHHRVHMIGNYVGYGSKYGHKLDRPHLVRLKNGRPHVYGHWNKHAHGYDHKRVKTDGRKSNTRHRFKHVLPPPRHPLAKVHLDHEDVDTQSPPSRTGRGGGSSQDSIKLAREIADIKARGDTLFVPVDEIVARSVWASVEDLD